jgi:hypothetical protein
VSAPGPLEGKSDDDDGPAEDHTAAAAALRAAFARLRPQGSDAWNFLAAFTHLGDRYGPYHPGASDLSRKLEADDEDPSGRAGAWKRRILQRAGSADAGTRGATGGATAQAEFEQAMAQVVEAFRFLSARVRTLEERLGYEDRPVDGAAWLLPAPELGIWVEPVATHIVGATPGGDVVHGDCGEGALLGVLREAGLTARGAEPRGAVALRALERGHAVSIAEVAEELATCAPASLGGLVLSGVVDRVPIHSLVSLLDRSRQALALGAPIVVVASAPDRSPDQVGAVGRDILRPQPLHAETWTVLLQRAGFVSVAPLVRGAEGEADVRADVEADVRADVEADVRFALAAAAPA